MKLFTAPGACSLSCHIAMEEAKIPFEATVAGWDNPAVWAEIGKLNPQDLVPVLVLDNGKPLTQNIGILTYIAERAPQANLLPPAGTVERAQVYQWVSWVGADLHKAFHPLFDDSASETDKKAGLEHVTSLLEEADRHLEGRNFLVGNTMTIADCYLFTVYSWTRPSKVPTDKFRNLNAYHSRIVERPATQAAMKREGLLGGKH